MEKATQSKVFTLFQINSLTFFSLINWHETPWKWPVIVITAAFACVFFILLQHTAQDYIFAPILGSLVFFVPLVPQRYDGVLMSKEYLGAHLECRTELVTSLVRTKFCYSTGAFSQMFIERGKLRRKLKTLMTLCKLRNYDTDFYKIAWFLPNS